MVFYSSEYYFFNKSVGTAIRTAAVLFFIIGLQNLRIDRGSVPIFRIGILSEGMGWVRKACVPLSKTGYFSARYPYQSIPCHRQTLVPTLPVSLNYFLFAHLSEKLLHCNE